jgi:hypothetical protein
MASAVPAISLQPAAIGATGYSRELAMAADRGAPRKAFSRKLTGWLVGDGTVTVRPFPTVSVRQ